MKKIILSLFILFSFCSAFAQSSKLRVAVSFNTDTTFSILGPLSIKSLNINLNPILYNQIAQISDINSFLLKPITFPDELSAAGNAASTGIPKKYQLQSWLKKIQKEDVYDLLLIIYKPVQLTGTYSSLGGLSYGINTSKGIVFSLNNALVYDIKTMKLFAATSIESESDYIAGSIEIDKTLPYDHKQNIESPVQMINALNQDFALKVVQCLLISKKKLENTTKN